MTYYESHHGGRRPGAGRPKGSKNIHGTGRKPLSIYCSDEEAIAAHVLIAILRDHPEYMHNDLQWLRHFAVEQVKAELMSIDCLENRSMYRVVAQEILRRIHNE